MSYLYLPNLKAQNINVAQSPFVYGVPSPPTWIGFVDSLMRDIGVGYDGVGVLIHHFEALAYGSVKTFAQSRHPLKKNGDIGSIIEEAKGHINASVLIELTEDISLSSVELADYIQRKRLAGGIIMPLEDLPQVIDDDTAIVASGHWLTISDQQFDSLDEWIDITQHRHTYNDSKWSYERSEIVPLMVGYAALETPIKNPQSRNPSCSLVRVEALHGAGKWIPHRYTIEKQSVLFRRKTDLRNGLFICI